MNRRPSLTSSMVHRRTVLRGAGGVALGLPWLEAMEARPARAATPLTTRDGLPQRLVIFWTPNGTLRQHFVPPEDLSRLPRILEPLAPWKRLLTVADRIDDVAAQKGPGGDFHMKGMASNLAGVDAVPGGRGCGGTCTAVTGAGGPSFDQVLADRAQPRTKLRTLELGVGATGRGVLGTCVYKGRSQPLPLENDPGRTFSRLFDGGAAGAGLDDAAYKRLRDQKRSVLDGVVGSYRRLIGRVSTPDRATLQAHADLVRDHEQSLGLGAGPAVCAKPASAPSGGDFQALGKAQMDVLALALSCDLTRIVTLQWSQAAGGPSFPWLGINRGHHDISHDPDGNANSQEQLAKINVWYAQQLAYLAGKLASLREGTGSVLDNTLIVWANELSKGNTHSVMGHTWVMLGGAGGAIKTGQVRAYQGRSNNDLLLTIARALGVPLETFGHPDYNRGPLDGLT